MKKDKKKLGELLKEAGMLDDMQLNSALAYQSQWGGRLGSIIIKQGYVSEQDMVSVIEKQYGIKCVSLETFGRPSDEALGVIKAETAKKFSVFPVSLDGKVLTLATADPTDLKTLDDLSFVLGVRVKPVLALESDITDSIAEYYDGKMRQNRIVIDREKIAAKLSKTVSGEIRQDMIERPSVDAVRQEAKPKAEMNQKVVIESIVDLLVAKGIFTREELITRIRQRSKS